MIHTVQYLAHQLEKARAILFTGAGFSLDARNVRGESMPTATRLRDELWLLCFPATPVDPDATLQTTFEAAILRNPRQTTELLASLLSVDGTSLPDWYARYFNLPWFKCYTLNIDDLPLRLEKRTWVQRKVQAISATTDCTGHTESDKDTLRVIHLNGTISDLPRNVTFSVTQYAARLAREEPLYTQLSAELLSHPFLFVGTTLDESPLWQHIQLRSTRAGSGLSELRPKSFLVTPHLDKAREVTLSQYNVEWIPMTAAQFANDVLSQLESTNQKGLHALSIRNSADSKGESLIPEVSSLVGGQLVRTDFLLGSEPVWSDIQAGRAMVRESDKELLGKVNDLREGKGARGLVVLTGTAGSGKSTALMRIALALTSAGVRVGWIDRESEISLRGVRHAFQKPEPPQVLAIDDADSLGVDLGPTLRDVCLQPPYPLALVAIRSNRIDRALNSAQLAKTPIHEYVMPLLTNADISGLLDSLEHDNKLGQLRGLSRFQQESVFRERAGRELLVAMIEATSGERFEEKAVREYEELEPDKRRIYAIVAVATALQFSLEKRDVLIALAQQDNASLNNLDQLLRRNIIVVAPGHGAHYRARHRVLAELV